MSTHMPLADRGGHLSAILMRLQADTRPGTDPAAAAGRAIDDHFSGLGLPLPSLTDQRQMMAALLSAGPVTPPAVTTQDDRVLDLCAIVTAEVVRRGGALDLFNLPADTRRALMADRIRAVVAEGRYDLNAREVDQLVDACCDEMFGYGPLQALMADPRISDIMINGPTETYVEVAGKLEKSPIRFRDTAHLLQVATRIISDAGRRVDETVPFADARMKDGSRVNVIIPPLALDSPTITIRKFPQDNMGLSDLVRRGSLTFDMARYLKIAAMCRFNIIVSGGTGSGKTTMLNALSKEIAQTERIVTIEDAAELRLQQPHVVRLETRPPFIDGTGEITMRQLLRNSLRMRPDRIILGEVRGPEVIDLLQAMNTGHDGSLSTIHANSPREAVSRLSTLVALSGVSMPQDMLLHQLRDALHLFVQVARMRDGVRRVVSITEVVGAEPGMLSMQEIYSYAGDSFHRAGVPSAFVNRAAAYGQGAQLAALLEGA